MTAELRFLLGQVLGILATVITVISYQMNTKRSLLLVQTTATAVPAWPTSFWTRHPVLR